MPELTATLSACAILARIAWPNENDDNQAQWAHRIAIDPRIGANTYQLALEKSAGNEALRQHVEGAVHALRDRGVLWAIKARRGARSEPDRLGILSPQPESEETKTCP